MLRGQLVDSPGYMANYAIGAMMVMDLRARARALRGPFTGADAGTYAWLSERLYRFGRERPARRVLEDLLCRPVSADALRADLARAAR
jgi:predicted metal-dependent HD superfamily phosphohydrolase